MQLEATQYNAYEPDSPGIEYWIAASNFTTPENGHAQPHWQQMLTDSENLLVGYFEFHQLTCGLLVQNTTVTILKLTGSQGLCNPTLCRLS